MRARRITSSLIVLGFAAALSGCTTVVETPEVDAPATLAPPSLSAEIRYSSHGIPHVKAETFEGAGFGAGYAYAGENLCLTAEHMVTLRGERSLFFGPEQDYYAPFVVFNSNQAAPRQVNNLESDAYFKFYYTDARLEAINSNLSPEASDLLDGFIKGFNRRLGEHRREGDGPDCVGQPWLSDMTRDDMMRRVLNTTILDSADLLRSAMAVAGPPVADQAQLDPVQAETQMAADFSSYESSGSNALAFGRDATENGGALVFGNPHFPWNGTERQYAVQLTVGDEYDVFGSTLTGVPVPLIGFNESMAWSITFSTDKRTAIYALELDPTNPTRYKLDGEFVDMTSTTVTIPLSDGGSETRTFYSTAFGPIFEGGPFAWTEQRAYAVWDFSVGNNRMLDTYLDIGRATNARDVKKALDDNLGLQYSNLVAGDATGEVLYSNISVGANFSDEKLMSCFDPMLGQALFAGFGLVVLKGEMACLHDTAADAVQSDAIPASKRPSVFRTDYVTSSNDSHWITNADPESFLGGFQMTIGKEQSVRGERTRGSIAMAEDRLAGRDGLPGNKMSSEAMLKLFYESSNQTADLILDDLVAECSQNPSVTLEDGEVVDLLPACAVLADWDRTHHVDSRGALLFEAFMRILPRSLATDYLLNAEFWRVPFDPADPLNTPNGLQFVEPVRRSLAAASKQLADNGIPLDARYGDHHGVEYNGEVLGLSGGYFIYNLIRPAADASGGFTGPITFGNSYTQLVEFTATGPEAKFVMTYSQGTDSDSPHRNDQLPLYASGDWIDLPFRETDILASETLQIVTISE